MANGNSTLAVALKRFLGRTPDTGIGVLATGPRTGNVPFYSVSYDYQRISNSVYMNPTGYRCILAIERNFARPPWMVLPADAKWPQETGTEQALKNHPLLDLLNRPRANVSGTQFQMQMATDLEMAGKSFWLKERSSINGKITGLRRLAVQRMTVVGNQDDDLLGFIYVDRNGFRTPILPDNVLYLRYPHPERNYDGIAPGLIAGLPAETDTAASRFNRDLLANDGAIPGYMMIEGLSIENFQEWKAEWERGQQPGKTRFINATAAKYEKIGQSNQELTYAELRQDSQDDIMRAFGVPRAVAFDVSHETYANADREISLFLRGNILPKWVMVADEMTLQLGDDFNARVAFDLAGIDELQDSRDAVVERAVRLMGMQAMTVNEFRESQGWERVPWGDEPVTPLQPMSATPIQPPAAQHPHPAPAGPPAPNGHQPPPPPQPEQAAEGAVGDYRARHLIRWYNEGADGQIPWGAPGDFTACVAVAARHVRDPKGFCAERHHDATGRWPGQDRHHD